MTLTAARSYGFCLIFTLVIAAFGCGDTSSSAQKGKDKDKDKSEKGKDKDRGSGSAPASEAYQAAKVVGKIGTDELEEASGLAASGCQPDVLWTQNDAGDGPFIYAIGTDGRHLGTYKVNNAENIDWEDIAAFKDASGKCFLFIGDIGNNKEDRSELTVYGVAEPQISNGGIASNTRQPLETVPAESFTFKYPDQPSNAETIMVHPQTRDLYVVTKREKGPAGVYKIKPAFGSSTVAEKVGELTLPAIPVGLMTGGSISPDGTRVVLCDYENGYELVLPSGGNFDSIWTQQLTIVDLGKRKQGEAVTYSADGNAIFATSEGKNPPLARLDRR